MEEKDKLRSFYDNVSSYLDIGSYDDFYGAMQDPSRRQKFFDSTSQYVDIGDSDKFNQFVGDYFGQQQPAPRVDVSDVEAQQQPQVPQMGAGDVDIEGDGRFKPSWGFERSQKMQDKMPEPKPTVKTVNEKTEYDFSQENVQGMREFAEGAYVKAFDEVNALMPEIERSIRERALFDTEQNNRNKDASREAIEYHANKEADRRIKQFREKMEKEGTAGFSGESLASYLAFDDEELRDKIASAYNDKDAVDKYMQAYYQSPEGKAERTREADNAKVMVDELKGKRSQGFWNTVGGMFGDMAISASMAEGGMSYQDQQQLSKIQDGIRRTNSVNMAINQSLHEAENTLNVAIKNIEEGKGNAFVQLGRGVRYANLDNVIPMSDLYGQMGVLQLYEKLDEDGKPKEPLTQDEQTLYESLALNKYVSDKFGGYQTMLNRIGSGLPEQAMFTLSFLLSSEFAGAQAIGRGATNVLRRGIGNVVNKEIKSGIGRFMLDKALPTAFGMGAETLYRTGLQVPAIMSGAIERHVGTIKVNPETGEVGGFENGVDWDEALWKSTLNVANETGTELVGDRIIEPGLGWFGRNTAAGKRIADFRKYIGEIGDGTVDDILKMGDDISHKAGWSKWYIEVGEEEVGAFNNAAFIHDQTWEEAFSRKALMETTLNCMIFGVAMGTSTTSAQAMRNMPSTVTTRNEKRKASRIIDKMDGISTDEIDEHINNDSSNELADWLVDKSKQGNSNGDWTNSQRAAVANYVRTSIAQKAERNYKDMQLQNEVKAMEERVDDMTNNQSGDVIEANFKIDGQMQTGTIVGGRVSVVENDVVDSEGNPKQAFTYNPNLSSVTLIVRVENPDGTVTKKQVSARDIESINSVAEAEQYKGERRSELEMNMQRSVVDMYTTPTASDIWGTDLQAGVVLPYNDMLLRLDGKDENGQWILTRVDEEGTPIKKTNPFVLSDSEFRIMGMTERLRAMQQQGAPQEDIDNAVDDINTEQDLQNIDQSDDENNIWDDIAGFMKGYTQTNEEGDFIPEASRPEAAAGYLVALQKGDIGKTIAIVNERIAELEARLASKPAEVQNNGEGVVAMAGNESMAEDAYIETQKQIMFLSNIRDGLIAKQEQQNEIEEVKSSATPVSQMEVGQQFPVEWRGQQAMATVMGKDADGRSVVTVRDMDGEDIEAGIDDMSDAQWEAVRVQPQETTAPEQVPPQAPPQAPEQVEPQQEVPQAAPQQEPQQAHPLDDFIAKHGENAENKLGVTVDAINKEIASLAKDLDKAEKDLANMPEPYDEKTQKAQDKQEAKIAKLRAELDEKRNILAPYAAMQEELDRRKEVRQGRENGVTDALTKFTERLNNMLHPKRESQESENDFRNIYEFIARKMSRKGIGRTSVKTYNKKTGKTTNGWRYVRPVDSFDIDSFKAETGWKDSEIDGFKDPIQPFFVKNGGKTFGEFVHSVWESAKEEGIIPENSSDADVRDAVIAFLQEVQSVKDINDYIEKHRRDEQAEQEAIANDMIAQHNGYESGEAMENDLIAQASARADELLGSDTLSDEDVAAFDAELSQRLDNLVPSVEETAKETEPATQETTVESTEDEDFIQPTDEEVPFSVVANDFQKRFEEIDSKISEAQRASQGRRILALKKEKAALIQDFINKIKTDDFTVLTEDNYEEVLRRNGIGTGAIKQVKDALRQARLNGDSIGGFRINGMIYMFSDDIESIEHARTTYVHERQHNLTDKTKVTENSGKVVSLRDWIKKVSTREQLKAYVRRMCGSPFYDNKSDDVLADEFVSMAMELAYTSDDVEAALKSKGIENKQLINTIKLLSDEQRKSNTLSKARKGEGRNLHVDNNVESDGGQDDGDRGSRPAEVGGQRPRPVSRGEQTTGSGEVSGILPIDKQTPKNTTIDEVLYSIKVNHNSPYLLKKADGSFVDPETGETLGFDHRFMSNGEGAQAHGWGSYFSVNDLRSYAGQVKNDIYYQGKLYDVNEVNNHISEVGQRALNWFLYGVEPDKYTNDKDGMLSIIDKAINSYEVLWSGEKDDYYNRQIEQFKDMRKFVEDHGDEIRIEPQRHHYNVEIPDNNGTNYFEESEPLKPEQIAMLQKQSDKENAKVEIGGFLFYANPNKNPNAEKYTFRNFLSDITSPQGGITQKQASEFFSRAGFVGTHYDGKRDGECYVIFDENDAKIVDHVRFSVREKNNSEPLYSVTSQSSEEEKEETYFNGEPRFSVVADRSLLLELERSPKVKVYRAMQMRDGKLYPPMAGKVNGEWQNPIELGVWEQADEHPELVDKNGKFKLDKGNGKYIKAAYNPYLHTSRSPLNDQFSSAWDRPELVTVEVEVPESELTSGYKAEKAKNAVGEVEWKSGPVSGKLAKKGNPRKVILSRYDKPIRIVPAEEVAERIAEMLEGTGLSIPFNTVTPELRDALVAQGVQIGKPQKGNAGNASMDTYNDWKEADDLRFSTNGTHVINNGKSLVGIHNIGADKLRKAMKNGGFANPSAAVIDIDKQEHKGYGEVSLIMPSSLVDSRTGRNAGTYAGDAYTPEYPNVTYREGKNTDKLVKDLVKGLPKELGWAIRQGIGEYMDGNRSRSGLEYLFLKEKGQEMPIVKNERRYPDISTEQIDKRLGVENSANRGHSGELYAAYEKLEGDDLVDFNMWFEAYGDEEKIQQRKDLMERNARVKELLTEQFGEHMGYGKFDTTWYNVFRDERDAGNENIPRTLEDAAMKIDELGLRNEFEDWKQKTIDGLGYEEVIFDGNTPSGYRRYVPNTVENASRIMNKKDKTNWLSDAGTHATKAMLLDKFNKLNDIRKNRGLLESDQEVINQAYEEASDAWSELGSELAEMQKVDDNRLINHDIALNRLQEAMMKSNPVAYLNKEYKYNLDEEFNDRIKEVKQQIKSLPSKYFETKFRRPVYLNEFAAAVVPNDLPQDLKERLQQSGLPLFEYDPNKEGDRRAVTLEATEGDGIRFSVANRNQAIFVSNAARAVEGIKQEKATPEQWLKMVEKNGGLKAGEDKWLGLSQWLKESKAKTLTKQEVLDFINENAIKIEETHYGNMLSADSEAMQPWQEEFREEIENAEMLYDDADNRLEEFYTEMEDKYGADYLDQMDEDELAMEERLLQEREDVNTDYRPAYQIAFDAMVDDHGDDFGLAFYPTPSGLQISDEDAASYFLGGNQINATRLEYTTEGLNNKREIALTVPTIEPWNESDEIHFGDAGEGRAVAWIRFGETTTERELTDEERSEIMPPADKWEKVDGSNFVSKHDIYYYPGTRNQSYNSYIVDIGDGMFEIQGPIVRRIGSSRYPSLENAVNAFNRQYSKDRGLKKEKVLVIDEIQSKRHQEGREKGYKSDVPVWKYDPSQQIPERERYTARKLSFNTWIVYKDNEPEAQLRADSEEEAIAKFVQTGSIYEHEVDNRVPVAPFEKNWMELAMKRMLRLAAEEGYDKVAWTTGEQQAERYNIGNVLGSIDVSRWGEDANGYFLGEDGKDENIRSILLNVNGGENANNDNIELIVNREGQVVDAPMNRDFVGKQLADIIGKDLSLRVIQTDGKGTIDSENLRIGGEGMKGFYDKMIPSFMNKYGKQWGVKVGEVTMPNLEEGYQTMHSIDVNEQMKADVMEGQVMFSVKNSQKDADDNQLSLFLQNNTGEYETQDGQTIGFTSLLGAATEADAVRGRDNVQRGDDILSYHLRRLEPGETCHVERRYQKSKMFDFTGSEKIESADDVAYIFNKLEDAAVENSFIVLVKDGKPTIIHTGVGSYGSTYVNLASALVAYKNINPDEVWFVHNHPSGSITSSQPDRDSSKRFEKVFGKKYKGGIIIDTTSGKYGVFDSKSDTGSGSTRNTPSNETDIAVYEFSKQVFDKDWNPETAFRARTHQDIATFVSSHRLGEHDKMSLLVLNNNTNVVGNVFLPYESIGEADIKKLTDDVLYYTNQMAGTQAVIYGSFTADDVRDIKKLANNIANAEGRLVDVISTNSDYTGLRSVRMMGAIKEDVQEIKEDEAKFSVTAQQDKDYMDAVNRGDMETAQRMVMEAAKAAMPNTKVVDENGNPLVVYHGSGEEFTIFKRADTHNFGYHFGSIDQAEEKDEGVMYEAYLNIENPYRTNDIYGTEDELVMDEIVSLAQKIGTEEASKIVEEARKEYNPGWGENWQIDKYFRQLLELGGYDGLVYDNAFEGGSDSYVALQPSQIKSADPVTYDDEGNVIPLSERFNPNNNDIRFSVNGQQRRAVADEFNRRTGANMEDVGTYTRIKESLIRDWFDGLHPLEQAQKLIEEKLGRKLRDSEKAYELATQTTSVSAAMIDEEEKKHIIPILNKATELIRKMMNNDRLSREEAYRRLSNYMLAKHGLERNKWFHEQALLNDPNAEEEDKSGLTGLAAMLGENPDDYKAVAERIVKEFEDEYDSQEIDDYWNEMRGLTNRLLEISYESGMIDKDTYDNLKKRHKFYVPLRGFGEGTIGDIFDYIGQMPHFQETLKKAKGRKSVAGDPLANLYNMLQSAIVIGNQNKVMQKLYNLAVNSNNDLLRLKKTWYVYDDVEDRWEERYPDIPKDATDAEIDAIVKKFDADMQAAKANGKAKTKLNKLDLAKKVLPYQAKQHEMVAYIDGKKVILQVVGNPVLAQALNKANQQQLGIFAETMQGITRFMSMINTSLSPAFMLTNSARDIGFALFSAMVTGGFKKTGQMAAWMATSGWVIPRLMTTGKLDAGLVKALGKQNAAQIEQWWNEFTQNGGETGFTRTLSAEKARGQVDDMIRHMLNGSKDGESRLKKATVDVVNSAGRWSEDISRFAAYCWSRAQGNSVMESVNEAKNVTVNFNVKGGGRLAASCRAVYSFFNAALQGIGRMARLAKENPKAFAACLTACMLQGAVLPWLNMLMFGLLGGDDDDWKKYEMLTEYTANKNLVLYVGNHKFLKIPYSQELAPFAAMGNIFFRQQMGWNKGESVASQVGKMFLDLAPVSIGESKTFMGKAIKTATPTALMPFVELWMNEDFTGSPIQKDNQWNKYARGWERAYEGKTSKWLVDASKWLDDKTGIDISPAVAEHMFSGVLGGIGRSGDKLLRYFSNGFQLQDAPFIRTLMFDSKQQGYVGAVQREYGRNAYDVLDKVKHDVENMDAMEFARFSQTEEFEIANLVSIYKTGKDLAGNKRDVMGIDKMEKEYKKLAGMSDGSEEYREHLEAIKADITERKMELLDEIEQIKYEHANDLRKRIIDRVNEVERESKEKYKRRNGEEK